MTIMEMLGQSGVLTVLGMGIVFSFLVIMVITVSAMGRIIRALGLGNEVAASGAGEAGPALRPEKTTAVTAAIIAAVTEYQKDNS